MSLTADVQRPLAVDVDQRSRVPAASGSPGPATSRLAVLDNARFILIGLVVFGHAIQPLASTSTAVESVYVWIYLFHMPAFVLLCGLVVRDTTLTARRAAVIVSSLLVPLLILEVVYRAFDGLTDVKPQGQVHALTEPSWALWFLLALAVWRVSVPLLAALRWPVAVTLVFALVLSALVELPKDFSIGRIIMLAPFFAAGLLASPEALERLGTRRMRMVAVGVLLAAVPFAMWASVGLSRSAVLWTGRGASQGLTGLLTQSLLYFVAALMIVSLLALIPRRRFSWTWRGANTLTVYLLHIVPVLVFRQFLESSTEGLVPLVLLALTVSVVMTLVLSSEAVVRRTKPLLQPQMRWLLRDDLVVVPASDAVAAAARRSN
jgi:fucose 4-O-acetylase-like acetyltransferase